MKPSDKAIEAMDKVVNYPGAIFDLRKMAEAAYAIDVDPMQEEYNGVIERLEGRIREKDKEIKRLRQFKIHHEGWESQQILEKEQRISELESQVTALRDDLQRDIELTVTQHRRVVELEAEKARIENRANNVELDHFDSVKRVAELEESLSIMTLDRNRLQEALDRLGDAWEQVAIAQQQSRELEAENARLRELVEIYVPKTEVPK